MSNPARTDPSRVQGILGDNYDRKTSLDVGGFIDSASMTVDRVQSMALAKGITLSDVELEIIERWLAAHNYCVADPLYVSKSTMSASGSFQRGNATEGFASTQYGRMAMDLDYSKCLTNLNKQQRVGSYWVGKPLSEQLSYEDRNL